MAIVTIKLRDLSKTLRKLGPKGLDAVRRGILSGCHRGVAEMQNRTTEAPVFFSGRFKMGWKAAPTAAGARIYNDAPYAPIIEEGRRPGGRQPPTQVIQRWVQIKMGLSDAEAKRVAFPVARAIAKRGLPAHHLLRDAVPALTQLVEAEVQKEVDRMLSGAP